jgi:hypothetical protein
MSLKRNALNKPWCCLCTIIIVGESTYKLILMPAVLPGSPHMSRGREHQKSDPPSNFNRPPCKKRLVLPAGDATVLLVLCMSSSGCRRKKQATPSARGRHPCVLGRSNPMPPPLVPRSQVLRGSAPMPAMHESSPADDANILRDNGDLVRAVGACISFPGAREHLNYPDEVEI